MESQAKKPKKIEVSASSLVALKAELLNKQTEVLRTRSSLPQGVRPVKKGFSKQNVERPSVEKKNKGVERRAKHDEDQHEEETPSLDKARMILEEKAKLYERLSRDKSLLDEDTITEEESHFLVDFQQKVVENVRKEVNEKKVSGGTQNDEDDISGNEEDYRAKDDDEEWVDFVDSFGRTRRCQKKDLPQFQQRDFQAGTKTATYSNFVKGTDTDTSNVTPESAAEAERKKQMRQQWEQDEEINRSKSNIHYQDVLYQEARQHGAGFYAFARDEEERAEQMSQLERMRQQTEAARSQQAAASAKKQTALQTRLLKIRQRKRQKLGLPPLEDKETPVPVEEDSESIGPPLPPSQMPMQSPPDEKAEIRPPSLPQTVRIRPWDLGKEGVPKVRSGADVVTQSTWVEKKRQERQPEFAPPAEYSHSSAVPPKRGSASVPPPAPTCAPASFTLSEESIAAGLSFIKNLPSRPESRPDSPDSPERPAPGLDDSDQEQPSVSAAGTARWRPKPTAAAPDPIRKRAEIPPPTSMDYYVHQKVAKTHPSSMSDLSDSFRMGKEANESGRTSSHPPTTSFNERWDFYGH